MIIAEVKESNKCSDDYSVYITFGYNQEIINKIKDKPIRYWHPNEKCWELPIKYFKQLQGELLKNVGNYQ